MPRKRLHQRKVQMIMTKGATQASRWRSKMKAESTTACSNVGLLVWMPKALSLARLLRSRCRWLWSLLDRLLSVCCRTTNRSSRSIARRSSVQRSRRIWLTLDESARHSRRSSRVRATSSLESGCQEPNGCYRVDQARQAPSASKSIASSSKPHLVRWLGASSSGLETAVQGST